LARLDSVAKKVDDEIRAQPLEFFFRRRVVMEDNFLDLKGLSDKTLNACIQALTQSTLFSVRAL
jgi:hypothetical protein